MANEITHALLQTNGGQVASVLSPALVDQLFDPTDLRNLMSFVPWDVVGSDTLDVTQDVVPVAHAAASSETSGGQANTAYTTSKFSLAIARYVIQYQLTDLLGIAGGPIGIDQVANKISQSIGLTMTDLLCALFGSLSNSVGTTTVDLVVDDVYDADFQLTSSNVGAERACVLYPEQINNFIESLRGETGTVQFQDATAEMLAAKGPGFAGRWKGIDFWQSDSVNAANTNADSAGAMFGPGCFSYTMGPASRILSAGHVATDDIIVNTGDFFIERNRDSTNGMSALIGNFYPAVVESEDARGVGIITDR